MEQKKVLFIASVVKIHIMVFHIPFLKKFKENGYEVHVAARNDYENKDECNIPYCDKYFDIPFERQPLKKNNIKAGKQLKEIIDLNEYEIIHCHTPIGGVLGRLAARNSKAKVMYTAHGFHFFDGAPTKNWLFFYPVEKLLSRWTDTLITINEEDYERAKTFDAREVELVNGVGIDLEEFKPPTDSEKLALRNRYGYDNDKFIMIYVGELSYRKHQDLLINVAKKLKKRIPNFLLLLVGSGDLKDQYEQQIHNLELEENVNLLGFRKDVVELMSLSDLAVSASRQEGLPVNIMEAMATGLPLVVTDSRGNRDLVTNNENGYVIEMDNEEQFTDAIEKLYHSQELRNEFGRQSLVKIQEYSLEKILKDMERIYR